MGNHYSDYLKKNVSVKDLVFDEIREKDKALLKRVKKAHIKSNMGFLVIFSIGFIACTYFFTALIAARCFRKEGSKPTVSMSLNGTFLSEL